VKKDISEEQEGILKGIRDCSPPVSSEEVGGVLKFIRDCNPEHISSILGPYGMGMQRFALAIDLNNPHPDLSANHECFDDLSSSFGLLVQDLLRIVSIGDLSSEIIEDLSATFGRAYRRLSYSYKLEDPVVDQLHVRFVPSRTHRDYIRSSRCVTHIEMPDLAPPEISDFSESHRDHRKYQKDIAEAKKRLKHFEEMNLPAMSENIKDSIKSMKEESGEYYGFNEISLVMTASILAESMGYELHDRFYRATRYHFKDYNFWYMKVGDNDLSTLMDGITGYHPQMYPYHQLIEYASDEIKELVDFLEEFPEINGLPLFDHYLVVVPGLDFPNDCQYPPYRHLTRSGEVFSSEDLRLARDSLNKTLIAGNFLNCALLGERAGKYYFISYWG